MNSSLRLWGLIFTAAVPVFCIWTPPSIKTVYRQQMDNNKDLQYNGNLKVGGQLLQGVFDTGSIELVVLSKRCHVWCGDESDLYDPKVSDRYKKGKYSLELSYGSGELLGREAYDSLTVGPFYSSTMPFWEVVDANMPLLFNSEFEVIIGLGPIPRDVMNMRPGALTNPNAYALMLDTLGLRQSSYSVCLGSLPGSAGWLVWNDNSVPSMRQAFTQLAVSDSGYWLVKMEDLRVGDITIACADGCGAILDSGTSLISMPATVKTHLEQEVVRKAWDCARIGELPDLKFKLDGVEHSLPPDAYLAEIAGNAPKGMEHVLNEHDNATKKLGMPAVCKASIMKVTMTSSLGPTYILGMPFFRSYYTTFAQRVGSEPPCVYTAKADQNCYPMASVSSNNSLHTTRRSVIARNIDASNVRMPPLLHKASITGRLEERLGRTAGSRLYVSKEIGPHGTVSGYEELDEPSMD